jgi:hypothetical protein
MLGENEQGGSDSNAKSDKENIQDDRGKRHIHSAKQAVKRTTKSSC